MIIVVVTFQDPVESTLARLFLQQLEMEQSKTVQSPHCEFRQDTTTEVRRLVAAGHLPLTSCGAIYYFSFTFFPFHVKTFEARWRAVHQIVEFLPYLDKHIKVTKSFMHGRMRSKQADLLQELTILS